MISPKTRRLLSELRDETKHLEELLDCNRDFTGSLRRVQEFAALAAQSVKDDHPLVEMA